MRGPVSRSQLVLLVGIGSPAVSVRDGSLFRRKGRSGAGLRGIASGVGAEWMTRAAASALP
jgi:hypothetical protein